MVFVKDVHVLLAQFLQLVHDWLSVMDKRESVDAVFLDFAKAFDKVSHLHLIQKLHLYGIHGQITSWIEDFLTARQQRVVVGGETSNWLDVTSGVPQGSSTDCFQLQQDIDNVSTLAVKIEN